MNLLLLISSVGMSTIRNLLSKNISDLRFGTKEFFAVQSVTFFCGSAVLIIAVKDPFDTISLLTVLYAIVYGMLLLSAQYCYTSALKKGNVGICSTVYSLGFIIPTLSGSFFWDESLTEFDVAGILMAIPTIVISGLNPGKYKKSQTEKGYIFPLLVAMFSSGGLGILQKLQQSSPYPEQSKFFVIFAFAFAGVISFVFFMFAKATVQKCLSQKIITAIGIGIAFGFSNLFNTILAGKLDSAALFPILNIGTILFSPILASVFFKERASKKDMVVLALGIISILLISGF